MMQQSIQRPMQLMSLLVRPLRFLTSFSSSAIPSVEVAATPVSSAMDSTVQQKKPGDNNNTVQQREQKSMGNVVAGQEYLNRQPHWPDEQYIVDARKQVLAKQGFIIDMDGVIYRGDHLLPGVVEFVKWLHESGKRFVFLTNSSDKTPAELKRKLARLGVVADESHFYTSALATAAFLTSQMPKGSAYVIGDPGLHQALYAAGYVMNDVSADYVVVGETRNYSYEKIERAVHLVLNGAKLIGTNCDKADPSPDYPGEVIPAAGSLITPIEKAAGVNAYFVGKPNPLMMRSALSALGSKRTETVIIGDRMDTDILGGLEAGIDSVLVLSGVTAMKDMRQWSFLPRVKSKGHFRKTTPADLKDVSKASATTSLSQERRAPYVSSVVEPTYSTKPAAATAAAAASSTCLSGCNAPQVESVWSRVQGPGLGASDHLQDKACGRWV